MSSVEQLIHDLLEHHLRENALAELAKKIGVFQDLAKLLWFSFGTITVLLNEVIFVYPFLSPPSLTPEQSNRVCNALALLQCVASHPESRFLFVKASIQSYLFVFLDEIGDFMPFERMRLSALGVVAALVEIPDSKVIVHLLSSDILLLCLRSMERGSLFSRTVATFILKKLLLDDVGLRHVCCKPERLLAVRQTLGNMVALLLEHPSSRPLRNVIRCYVRLLEDERSSSAVRDSTPKSLIDSSFDHCIREVLFVYPFLSPPSVTPEQSNRVCNARALLQCVVSHPEQDFYSLKLYPSYSFAFLEEIGDFMPFERMRLANLGVIAALVEVPDSKVIVHLLSSDVLWLSLHTMEMRSKFSGTVECFRW